MWNKQKQQKNTCHDILVSRQLSYAILQIALI